MKVLIVKTSSLGDIIHAFSIINSIKQSYLEAEIDWVVEKSCRSLVVRHPSLNRIIEIDTKKWRTSLCSSSSWKEVVQLRRTLREKHYDYVFDLQGNVKSGLVLACTSADCKVGFGKKYVAEWPNLLFTNRKIEPPPGCNIRDDYLYVVEQALKLNHTSSPPNLEFSLTNEEQKDLDSLVARFSPIIIIAPGSRWPNKCLSQRTLQEIISQLHFKYPEATCFYSWGTEEEKKLCETLAKGGVPGYSFLLSKQPLHALHYLMRKAKLVVAMDSLPLHLAGLTSTPTFSFFGPSRAEKYVPQGAQHITIQGSCPYGKTFDKRCSILRTCKTGACIKNLSTEGIINKLG